MASKHQDLWLWTFLGVFGFYAARAVHKQLESMRKVSEITEDQELICTEEKRNVLKAKTLTEFVRCPNSNIREIATKLVTFQASNGRTFELIIEGIASPNAERRDRSLMCLHYLAPNPDKFPSCLYDTYKALFECMRSLRPEFHAFETYYRDTPDTSPWDSKRHRARRKGPVFRAMIILAILLQHNNRGAVRAGFTQWLLEYPFGGDAPLEWKKKIILDITENHYTDPPMYTIITFAIANEDVKDQLIQHGLLDATKESNTFRGSDDEIGYMWYIRPDGMVESIYNSNRRNARRIRDESIEEQALRRRRREAMVLGESGRPIERGDIIERRDTDRDEEEFVQELEEVANEADVQGAQDAVQRRWLEWDIWRPRLPS